MKIAKEDTVAQATAQAASSSAESSTAQLALRPGGFVDFETGLYVAPPEDSKLDKTTGTF